MPLKRVKSKSKELCLYWSMSFSYIFVLFSFTPCLLLPEDQVGNKGNSENHFEL